MRFRPRRKASWALVLWTGLFGLMVALALLMALTACGGGSQCESYGYAVLLGMIVLFQVWLVGFVILAIVWALSRRRGSAR